MRVLVCGGRDFSDEPSLCYVLDQATRKIGGITTLIHGNAKGADRLAGAWAERHDIPVAVYPADWSKHGSAAGPIRNQQMLDEGKPDLVIAFPGGRGTSDMVSRATTAGIRVVRAPLPVDGG